MAKDTEPKFGRPFTEIDWEIFDKLCKSHCTKREVAWMFQCCMETIDRAVLREKKITFAEYAKRMRASYYVALRQADMRLALEKNDSRAIERQIERYIVPLEREEREQEAQGLIVEAAEDSEVDSLIKKATMWSNNDPSSSTGATKVLSEGEASGNQAVPLS